MNLLLSQREQEVSVPDQGFTVVLTGPGDQHYAKWTPFIQCICNQWPLKAGREQFGGEVPCSGTPRHTTASRSRGSNYQPTRSTT